MKLLIIEDNNEIQNLLLNLFENDYDIVSAYSGTEGLSLFERQNIDLVLLDIMLPGKTGDEVLKEIRQQSSVPVIIMTALSEKNRISEYLLAGANDYVTKPFDLDELAARVLVQLRNYEVPSNKSETLVVGNLSLNSEDFTAKVCEMEIRLSQREFGILSVLMKNPKQIFTKERLYEAVWQETYLPGDNSINTHLSNLRKKLARLDAQTDYIETIWGLGVRIMQVKHD
ncbi:response regulator transcription factor [Lactococcus kimchii]|uniref:response regulator transcription factor n=1 Tax=Lactococcus sp. S-13 TaxID=2507158 RepID=UPI001023B4D4|nr:response regulator transcription factor [Lactococcus sp. S-13]RZI48716.1 response regulator transcription factor [Lactococcus sp. S-13]